MTAQLGGETMGAWAVSSSVGQRPWRMTVCGRRMLQVLRPGMMGVQHIRT